MKIMDIDEEFEEWKPLLKFIMEYRLLLEENQKLKEQLENE
jgi:hypothetical protein